MRFLPVAFATFFLTIGASPAPVTATKPVTPEQAATRALMHSIFQAITTALVPSFNDEQFSQRKNRAKIEESLKSLSASASQLEAHASAYDRSFEFVAKSLSHDARSLLTYFEKGRYDEARFTLHNMTDNCIACHSTFTETRRFPDAGKFFADVDLKDLSPIERAHLQVMARQFDDALTSYEEVLGDRQLEPTLAVTLGSFSDYLKVAIGVKHDFKRPEAMLAKLRARPTTPLHVRQQIDRWLSALKEFDAAKVFDQPNDFTTGRDIMRAGRALMEFPRDRDGLIHYVTANALLSRYVHAHADRGVEVAESYYLLGIAESLLEHSFWLTRSDFFLESSIRLAPAAPFAPKAFGLLEENLIADNTGSSGTHVPDDIAALIAELRSIIERAQAKKN